MRVQAFRVPPYDNGTYVLSDDRAQAIIIDPSLGEAVLLKAVRDAGLTVIEILNTHGHGDHVHDNAAVKAATGATLGIHRLDAHRLAGGGALAVPPSTPEHLLEEGPLAILDDLEIVALHLPGHTEGSTSFHLPVQHILFSGDVLFQGTFGRVDLPGGDADAMQRSLARLAALPPGTTVYPGHGAPTTIGAELPWLRRVRVTH